MTLAAIASNALLKMLYSSLIAGIGVSLVFAIAVLAAIRSGERRRDHRAGAAIGLGVVAAGALLICAAAVVYGVFLVAHKS